MSVRSAPPRPRKRATRPGEGRPTKYHPKHCATIVKAMAAGHSILGAAGMIGVSRETIYAWAAQYPEFSDAKNLGDSLCAQFWEKRLLAISKSGGGPGAAAATIFALKNRGRGLWNDRQEINHSGAVGNYDLDKMSLENLKQLEALLQSAAVVGSRTGGDSEEGS